MADGIGQALIRGLDISKIALGFADEDSMFKSLTTQVSTTAREMRWYSKTAGFLESTTTTAITSSELLCIKSCLLYTTDAADEKQ